MDKKFKVIKGGLSSTIQKSEKKFVSAFATNTRLMGVFVLYIHWTIDESTIDTDLHQFFYIDAEEYGIESYKGILGDNFDSLYETEQSMLGGLGGAKVDLTEKEAIMVVQKHSKLTTDGGFQLPAGRDDYDFILNREIDVTPLEEKALFHKLCVDLETNEQTINYFLMRYFAKDGEAVKYLASQSISTTMGPNTKNETLCKNTIEPFNNPSGTSYLCESLIENNNRYQLVMSEIYLEGKQVAMFYVRSSFFVTTSEAAMMLGRPEFITVYEIMGDMNEVKKSIPNLYPGALYKQQENGHLYLQFKSNNDHLKERIYRLNDDVRGIFFVTEYGQLVAVSYSLANIHRIEKELQNEVGPFIIPSAKFEFKESVFYEFVQGDFVDFAEFMSYLNDFDPEDD